VGRMCMSCSAGRCALPRQLCEPASLDGASAWQRLRWVTLPSISPVILFAVVIGVIDSMQYFTQAYVAAAIADGQAASQGPTSAGYPEDSTLFYPVLLYLQAFSYF